MKSTWSIAVTCALLLVVVSVFGCGQAYSPATAQYAMEPSEDSTANAPAEENSGAARAKDRAVGAPDPNNLSMRKIIFRGSVTILVDDFDDTPNIDELVAKHGGFVSASRIMRESHQRFGEWTLRLPMAELAPLLKAFEGVGELTEQSLQSEEVTSEYYDLQARIKNKKLEETRLHQYLDEKGDTLEAILRIEAELTRVREDIERMEGRVNGLNNLTALSTIRLTIRQRPAVPPPPAPVQPETFVERIQQQWRETSSAMIWTGQQLVLLVVAIGPWLLLLAPFALIGLWCIRRQWRRIRTAGNPFTPVYAQVNATRS